MLQTDLLAALDRVETVLAAGSLDAKLAFASAFFILLREGLEAVLVLAAMFAFLGKAGRREAYRYLHIGWVGALAAGVRHLGGRRRMPFPSAARRAR